jgi:hypothetical protein
MKVKSVIRKVEKALGVKVEPPDFGKYWVHYNGHVISWRGSGSYPDEILDSQATGFHVRREDDYSDLQTDYFAGYFVKNPTQMINAVKPQAPKFKVGSLIRFKDTKRAQRSKVAGKMAIVMTAPGGGMCYVRFCDPAMLSPYHGIYSYYERDMALATA